MIPPKYRFGCPGDDLKPFNKGMVEGALETGPPPDATEVTLTATRVPLGDCALLIFNAQVLCAFPVASEYSKPIPVMRGNTSFICNSVCLGPKVHPVSVS